MIGGRRPLQGRKPADRRVRVERPHAPYFRYIGPGPAGRQAGRHVAADPGRPVRRARPGGRVRAPARRTRRRSASGCRRRRRWRSSARTPSARRPTRPRRSCASSCSPAPARCSCRSRSRSRSRSCWRSCRSRTARSAARTRTAAARTSWRRTNLAPIFGLIAAAALLIDYVMTVRCRRPRRSPRSSRSSRPAYDVRIEIAFVSISLITIANLRGLRESGNIFAVPTYLFVGLALAIVGDRRWSGIVGGDGRPVPPEPDAVPFGTRGARRPAAAQGVRRRLGGPDRRRGDRQRRARRSSRPEAKNAANTMTAMAVLLGILFIGLTVVAVQYGLRPTEEGGPSVVALAARTVVRRGLDPVHRRSRRARR